MNCIDKSIRNMKQLGYTHFSNIPNVQVYINRQHECMLSMIGELHNRQPKQEQDQEKEHHSLPTLEQVQEFVLFGGEITVNTYYEETVIDAGYRLVENKETASRMNLVSMAAAYLESFPTKRVVNLNF